MLLKPKEYRPDTDRYFEFIREIRDEIGGCVYQKNEGAVNHKWVTGLPAFSLLGDLFHKAYEDTEENKENIFNLSRSCLKLYEHQTILLEFMQTFTEHLSAESELSGIVVRTCYINDKLLLILLYSYMREIRCEQSRFREHAAVNRGVVGSSPTGGARKST